jgi:hypothetical protein
VKDAVVRVGEREDVSVEVRGDVVQEFRVQDHSVVTLLRVPSGYA